MFKIRLFTLTTCVTLSGVVLPALALEFSNRFNYPESGLDRSGLNLNKTRPEFTQPDLRNPIPLINSSPIPSLSPSASPPNNTSPLSTPNPTVSPSIVPIAPANPIPVGGAGAQGFGDRPITPTINTLPGTSRPEFQVPDLIRPGISPSPTPSPAP